MSVSVWATRCESSGAATVRYASLPKCKIRISYDLLVHSLYKTVWYGSQCLPAAGLWYFKNHSGAGETSVISSSGVPSRGLLQLKLWKNMWFFLKSTLFFEVCSEFIIELHDKRFSTHKKCYICFNGKNSVFSTCF